MARKPGRPRKPRTLADYGDVMTVDDVRELFHARKETIYRLIYSGTLRAVRFGRAWLVPKKSVVVFLENAQGDLREAIAGGR